MELTPIWGGTEAPIRLIGFIEGRRDG